MEKTAKEKKEKKVVNKPYFISPRNIGLLKACIAGNSAALLVGETGTGKTTVVREVAKEQDKTLVRVSVNGSMGVEEILGKWLVDKGTTVWQDGILTMALRQGHWVVMDEINAALPEILFVLHSLLDDDRKIILAEKDNEIVRPHADFRFFATMNPPEDYAGTKDMNKALISRFTAVLDIEVLDNKSEVQLLLQKGASNELALNLVAIGSKLRELKKKDYIFYFCSTRDLVQCTELVKAGLDFKDALCGSISNKMSAKEVQLAQKELPTYFTLPPPFADLPIEKIFWTIENHDAELARVRAEADEKVSRANLEIEKTKKDVLMFKRDSSDKIAVDILKKLKEVAKS